MVRETPLAAGRAAGKRISVVIGSGDPFAVDDRPDDLEWAGDDEVSFFDAFEDLEVALSGDADANLQEQSAPVAHHEGRYHADQATLDRLEGDGQVVFRYADNPNGSANDIAGIINDKGNVLGMMPHPERACEAVLGSTDGLSIFRSILGSVEALA